MATARLTAATLGQAKALRRAALVVLGALVVALSAQIAVPLPGTPVPMTLQVPAVLLVGGLLGPQLGSASMVLYLTLGAVGLPVFAPVGAPGVARLFGPTGGYLLACPVAASVTGVVAGTGRQWGRAAGAAVLGLIVIHAGGVAQLAALGGGLDQAVRLGSLPFLVSDVLKVALAALLIRRFGENTKALR